ncbi:MAG: 6-phospho-beta-glucosidase [Verrucomicrobia bacterium]|nr:6-phospho-beta-glucosidase [Verrucomicrobiota bacterium]
MRTSGIRMCIVGAGSSYTPELIDGILQHAPEELPVSHISLVDINRRRLDVMAGWAKRALRHSGREITIESGSDLKKMLDGCNFVITQIRVGGMQARYLDESIPLKYGVLGQETTGPGGMFKALRTIPPMLEIARTVERVAPKAFILNYTNPSGIVTEAVRTQTRAKFLGLCSGIPRMQEKLPGKLAGRFRNVTSYCVGLNHLGFIHRILSGRSDVTKEAIDYLASSAAEGGGENADMAQMKLAQLLNAIPIGYVQYYIYRSKKVREEKAQRKTRAQLIMEIEKDIFREAADRAVYTKPAGLKKRGGGGYAGITFNFMKAIHFNLGEKLACSVLNAGCVDGIPADAAVEVVCRVDRHGARPLPVGEIPLAFRGLVQGVKAYETLTVRAALTGEKKYVKQALLSHPLVGDLDIAEPLAEEMCKAHRLRMK